MPELPEVETVRRQLEPHLSGRRLDGVQVIDELWCAPESGGSVEAALERARIESVGRRGKYLLVALDNGRRLVMHLRMTGNLLWEAETDVDDPLHTRVRFDLDDGSVLRFVDVRRFGTGKVFQCDDAMQAYLGERLGPEPLEPEFSAEVLAREARGRRAPVKAFLLDQRRVAGVGNIYADEALFRARIHPLRPVGRLRRADFESLRDAIVESLEAGIAAEGASIDDYRHYNGESGGMQNEFLVHRREGDACPRCGREIVKLRAAGRGTYICTRCQPAPRKRAESRTNS